jgi:hypothetical protein
MAKTEFEDRSKIFALAIIDLVERMSASVFLLPRMALAFSKTA